MDTNELYTLIITVVSSLGSLGVINIITSIVSIISKAKQVKQLKKIVKSADIDSATKAEEESTRETKALRADVIKLAKQLETANEQNEILKTKNGDMILAANEKIKIMERKVEDLENYAKKEKNKTTKA